MRGSKHAIAGWGEIQQRMQDATRAILEAVDEVDRPAAVGRPPRGAHLRLEFAQRRAEREAALARERFRWERTHVGSPSIRIA
jgi:hypothetical protein